MSKQSEAKCRQAYVDKRVPSVCSNCKHFSSVVTQEPSRWGGGTWTKETALRCGLGGFKVKKMGGCSEHQLATAEATQG